MNSSILTGLHHLLNFDVYPIDGLKILIAFIGLNIKNDLLALHKNSYKVMKVVIPFI